jgi:hypothetical protein
MSMTIEIPDELATALKARAQAEGLSADSYVGRVLQHTLAVAATEERARRPLKSARGILAKYGPAPSAEEIDENRRDMLRGSIFAADSEEK